MPESESTGGVKTATEAGSLPKQVYTDILLEVAFANMWVPLMSGAIATGYLLLLGASEFEFGLLVSIGSLAGISAPIFSYMVDRHRDKKKLTLLWSLPIRLVQFLLAALPTLKKKQKNGLIRLFLLSIIPMNTRLKNFTKNSLPPKKILGFLQKKLLCLYALPYLVVRSPRPYSTAL